MIGSKVNVETVESLRKYNFNAPLSSSTSSIIEYIPVGVPSHSFNVPEVVTWPLCL